MDPKYDISVLPASLQDWLNTVNTSTITSADDLDLFFHCWIKPHCPACLSSSNPYPCSWCETSQVCVPNTVFPYPFGILAPLKTDEVCPMRWRERWELRARPFSCRCSSMTFVSVLVAVLATLLGVLLIWLAFKLGRWAARAWRRREKGWWRVRHWTPGWFQRRQGNAITTSDVNEAPRDHQQDDETAPLLA